MKKLIPVCCRSRRRGKLAAEALAERRYTNIKETVGIINWPYPVEK